MYGICDECEANYPAEQHAPSCRYHSKAPVDYLIEGTPERGYCIFNATTGDRIVERGQYVQKFAYEADALAWVAAQEEEDARADHEAGHGYFDTYAEQNQD